MGQYKTGTIAVTQGSKTVTGTATAWLANVAAGYQLIVANGAVAYPVESVATDGSLDLKVAYAGATASGLAYAIVVDFTTPDRLPELNDGDSETHLVLKQLVRRVQSLTHAPAQDLNGVYGRLDCPLLHMPLVNDLRMVHGAGAPTFTRASTATYVCRSTGLIKTAAVDEARFEENGYLSEGASTNTCQRSEAFDLWGSRTELNVTANAATAPDGTTTADKLVETTANNLHRIWRGSGSAGAGTYTDSVFLKAAERHRVRVFFWNPTDESVGSAEVDLNDGTVTANAAGTVVVEKFPDGWYRVSVTGAQTIGSTIYIYLLDGGGGSVYTGDGTSGVYAWGSQFEALPFASSYIPTTTAAVTRAADILLVEPVGNTPPMDGGITATWKSSTLGHYTAGSVWMWNINADDSGWNWAARWWNGAANNLLNYYDSVNQPGGFLLSFDQNDQNKYAHRVVDDTVSTFINGERFKADTTDAQRIMQPAAVGNIFIGHIWGHIKDFRVYDVGLSDAEINLL